MKRGIIMLGGKYLYQFKKKQQEKINNMVGLEIMNFYNKNNRVPLKNECNKIYIDVNRILRLNNVFVVETDLRRLINKKVKAIQTKIEMGKMPIYDKKMVYHKVSKKNKRKNGPLKWVDTEEMYPDSDENFSFIAGYTSNGVPYGITWEEQARIDAEYNN